VLVSLILQLAFSVYGFAQEATPQSKAGLQATSSGQIVAPVEVSSSSGSGGGGAIDAEWLLAITGLLVVTRGRRAH